MKRFSQLQASNVLRLSPYLIRQDPLPTSQLQPKCNSPSFNNVLNSLETEHGFAENKQTLLGTRWPKPCLHSLKRQARQTGLFKPPALPSTMHHILSPTAVASSRTAELNRPACQPRRYTEAAPKSPTTKAHRCALSPRSYHQRTLRKGRQMSRLSHHSDPGHP